MKKQYAMPMVEIVKFNYSDQVVAASGGCQKIWGNYGDSATKTCSSWEFVGWSN